MTTKSGSTSGNVTSQAPPPSAEGEVHLLDRLAVIYRYRHIALAVFALTAITVVVQGYTSVKVYQAQVRLLIEPERTSALPGSMQAEAVYEDPEIYFQTQYKIIKSREIGRLTAEQLKLDTVSEFNGNEAPPVTPLTLVLSLKDRVVGTSRPKVEVQAPKPEEQVNIASLVNDFLGRVSVEPVRGSHLVDVTFRAKDAKFAAQAANTLADVYVEQNLARRQAANNNMIAFIGQEAQKQKDKVAESQRALGEYREKQNAMSLDDKQNVVTSALGKYNDNVMAAKNRRSQKEAAFKMVQAAGSDVDSVPIVASDGTIQGLKTQLDQLNREKVTLLEK